MTNTRATDQGPLSQAGQATRAGEAAQASHLACPGELETLSHAFALCPAVAPAAEWVGRVFAAVAACPAPPPAATAEVLLVGNGGGWVAPAEAHQVWLLLRGSFLHAVWQLRCRCSLTGWGAQRLALGGGCCFMDGPTAVRPGTLLEAWERRRA
ncbi:hypothetical protein N2152v2_009261 [Parachlorella kessleri]